MARKPCADQPTTSASSQPTHSSSSGTYLPTPHSTTHTHPLTNRPRQPGQGGDADAGTRDLRAELEAAEAAHYAKLKGAPLPGASDEPESSSTINNNKRPLAALTSPPSAAGNDANTDADEDPDAKRRRILTESRAIDADDDSDSNSGSGGDGNDSADDSDDDDSSDDDDDAELQRELERVRRERIEKREAEERARLAAEQEARERDIALGNPLLNSAGAGGGAGGKAADFSIKRRWDDDVVFKNQARGTEEKGKRTEFINVSFLFPMFMFGCVLGVGWGEC